MGSIVIAGTAVTLDSGEVGGQSSNAEAVAEASADFPTLELKGPGEGECVEPGRGRMASAAEQAGTCASTFLRAGIKGLEQGVNAGLSRLPVELTLCRCNGALAVGAHLLELWRPQSSSTSVQRCPLGPKVIPASPVERPEGLVPVVHGLVGDGRGSRERSSTFGRAGVG
jgi:hypothetical protein